MTTREELQHLSIKELNTLHNLLVQASEILNSDKEILSVLSLNGKDMTLQLEFAKIAVFARIYELNYNNQKELNNNNQK